jgi:glycosyltransferase involved in cell wall biosynthesis
MSWRAVTPRVSVVVATRNRRQQLARALASVDAQRYRSFEVIVVDDGSTDGTGAWLCAQRPQDCVIGTDRPRGAATARNRGVAQARGEIVAFLDDDDAWHPAYLEVQVRQLDADLGVDLCTTGHVEIDPAGRVAHPDVRPVFEYPNPFVHMLAECPVHTLSVVTCRRTVFARIGSFEETLEIVHDLDWYLRVLAAHGRLAQNRAALVERAVPGGLVTRHRRWFSEERAVHRRVFAAGLVGPAQQRRIRASRALFFARIGFAKGDVGFGVARLAGAFAASPLDAARISGVRLRRWGRKRPAAVWTAGAAMRQ